MILKAEGGKREMRMIEIEITGKGKALAKLDERNPGIREAFFRELPMEGIASIWGEEIYFDVPLQMENENPSPTAAAGDVCYWSPGPAFCVFFGKTQPYSAVNHIGKVTEGLDLFRRVQAGDRIAVRRR
ncbi:MAG: cyclophilin-like fold protein [Methanothrix sp.]